MGKTRIVAAAALLGLTLATSAALAQGSVRIGLVTDMTGPLSDVQGPGSVEAAKIAIEEFGGTVLGRKIEVLSADHLNKADVGVAIARKWVDRDDVGLLLDLGNSAVAIAVQDLAKDKNKISITTGAASGELTNKFCNANSFHWGYDSYQFAKASTGQIVKGGGDTWFFITADYAFGHALENDARRIIESSGGKVVGAIRHPINTADYSSMLLQAQASGAKVIGIASAVSDLQNILKQGREFDVFGEGQRPAALPMLLPDVHALGLRVSQGVVLSTVAYWDTDDKTRGFADKFRARMGRPPSEAHAMNYSAVLHYLKAVAAAKTTDTAAVIAQMRQMPIDDAFTKGARIRADGRIMRDIHLARIKSPGQSKGAWDYLELLGPIKAEDAFRSPAESVCALLKRT